MLDKKLVEWLVKLRDSGALTLASCPSKHRSSIDQHINSDILAISFRNGRGYVSIKDLLTVQAWIDMSSAIAPEGTPDRAAAIVEHGDSKANGKTLKYLRLSLRSVNPEALLHINDQQIKIAEATALSGELGVFHDPDGEEKNYRLNAPLYLIENLESWAEAERFLPNDGIFLHYAGWVSEKLIDLLTKRFQLHSLVLAPDYDLVGLSNWLRLKSIMPEAKMFFPDNFDALISERPSSALWAKQLAYKSAVAERLSLIDDDQASYWFAQMTMRGACLEQEYLHAKRQSA
ncbi:hypothetical protein RYA05_05810 [Pseudomonas syringae pv. actinidiae]|nr:hypothetical protein [Pseudomonas syringae pv. actinidiae]